MNWAYARRISAPAEAHMETLAVADAHLDVETTVFCPWGADFAFSPEERRPLRLPQKRPQSRATRESIVLSASSRLLARSLFHRLSRLNVFAVQAQPRRHCSAPMPVVVHCRSQTARNGRSSDGAGGPNAQTDALSSAKKTGWWTR